MERQYRNHLSGYLHWDQLVHAEDWLLFEKNIGAYLCIDEVALSRGELYTVLTNKDAHGGKGSMIAIIKDTTVIRVVPEVMMVLDKVVLIKSLFVCDHQVLKLVKSAAANAENNFNMDKNNLY